MTRTQRGALIVGVVGFGGFVFWVTRREVPLYPQPADSNSAGLVVSTSPPSASVAPSTSALLAVKRSIDTPEGVEELKKEYLDSTRFDPNTRPIANEEIEHLIKTPIAARLDAARRGKRLPDGSWAPTLFHKLSPERGEYRVNETISLSLIIGEGKDVTPKGVTNITWSAMASPDGEVFETVTSTNTLGVGRYEGRWLLRGYPKSNGQLFLRAQYKAEDGQTYTASTTVRYDDTEVARVEKIVSDKLDAGNLVVEVEATVFVDGNYSTQAILYEGSGPKTLLYARALGTLKAGPQKIQVMFDGLALREGKSAGPYVVRGVRLTLLDEARMLPLRSKVFPDDYRTQMYALSSFREAIWDSPEKRAKLALYDAEIARLKANPEPSTLPTGPLTAPSTSASR